MKFAFSADWHIGGRRPVCRLDTDWIDSQRQTVRFIVDCCNEHGLSLFQGGDLFDLPRVGVDALHMISNELVRIKTKLRILAGNHDLKDHSYRYLKDSYFGIIAAFFEEINKSDCHVWQGQPFGLDDGSHPAELVFSHQLVFPNEKARPMGDKALGRVPSEVLEQFPNAKIVCVGDYHHKFVYRCPESGRMVVNPGCINIQDSDMIGYEPSFYVVDTETMTVDEVLIPHDPSLVTNAHIVAKKERKIERSTFVDAIKQNGKITLDFKKNLRESLDNCEELPVREFVETLEQETLSTKK